MAKATITVRQSLQYQPAQADWFAATERLFNQVAAFYFEVIQARRVGARSSQQRGPLRPGKAHPRDKKESHPGHAARRSG